MRNDKIILFVCSVKINLLPKVIKVTKASILNPVTPYFVVDVCPLKIKHRSLSQREAAKLLIRTVKPKRYCVMRCSGNQYMYIGYYTTWDRLNSSFDFYAA